MEHALIVLVLGAEGIEKRAIFTYDDWQATRPSVPPPNRIISIREGRYKLAKYDDADGVAATEWEMYDLEEDPLETREIAAERIRRTKQQQHELRRLKAKLARVEQNRLQPL